MTRGKGLNYLFFCHKTLIHQYFLCPSESVTRHAAINWGNLLGEITSRLGAPNWRGGLLFGYSAPISISMDSVLCTMCRKGALL